MRKHKYKTYDMNEGQSRKSAVFFCVSETIKTKKKYYDLNTHKPQVSEN